MLVITDITVVNTNDDRIHHAFHTTEKPFAKMMSATAPYQEVKVTREDVQGQRFYHPQYGHVVIGWCAKAEKALRIPLEIFSRYEQKLTEKDSIIRQLKKELEQYKK